MSDFDELFSSDPLEQENQEFLDTDLAKLQKVGTTVYREVWTEFYKWEPDYCQQRIDSLADDESAAWVVTTKLSEMIDHNEPQVLDNEMDMDSPSCVFARANPDGTFTESRIPLEEIFVEYFEPHPNYESCLPTNKSFACGRGSFNLPFIPYEDEPEFDVKEFLKGIDSFHWESDHEDPDIQLIDLETARRMHYVYDISLADIDRSKILPRLRESDTFGLLWEASQRDLIHWPGAAFNEHEELPTSYAPASDDLRGRLNSILPIFCPNLNCMQAKCPTHECLYPVYDAEKPKVTSISMLLSEGDPCGEECFRYHVDDSYADTVNWEGPDSDILAVILATTADLFPCLLAILCHKPCREVFVMRSRLFPDHMIQDVVDEPIERLRKKKFFKDAAKLGSSNVNPYVPVPPCHHKGPCDSRSCHCYENSLHCSRNCRCDLSCQRRWKGCTCHRGTKSCQKDTCKCLRSGRECDPELCTRCDAKGATSTPCQNIQIQQGRGKNLIIKRGQYGLGAYASKDIAVNEFIGDYVGLLYDEEQANIFSMEYDYKGLNYLFEASKYAYIDALKMGNATRFVNHGIDGEANCEVRTKLVNNEIRIAFFAIRKIRRGMELLLNYGERYWNRHEDASGGEIKEDGVGKNNGGGDGDDDDDDRVLDSC